MATERVTVGRRCEGDRVVECWLELDGKCLWGGFRRESLAQEIADRLNTAFDATKADERKRCALVVKGLAGQVSQSAWIAEQIRKAPV